MTFHAPDVIKVMESKMTLRGGYRFLKISKFKVEKNKPARSAFIVKNSIAKIRLSTDTKMVFSGWNLHHDFDCVLVHLHTIVLQMPKVRKKIERRRYYDYSEIITTEYKWKTKIKIKLNKCLIYWQIIFLCNQGIKFCYLLPYFDSIH